MASTANREVSSVISPSTCPWQKKIAHDCSTQNLFWVQRLYKTWKFIHLHCGSFIEKGVHIILHIHDFSMSELYFDSKKSDILEHYKNFLGSTQAETEAEEF